MELYFLAVTDDATISQAVQQASKDPSWKIVVFLDPARVFSAPVERIHFLLLDEASTGKNYLSLIKRARKRYSGINTMVVGGPKSDEVRHKETSEGVDCYFERPIDSKALVATLEHRLKLAHLKATAGVVGRSHAIEEILEAVLQVAPTEVPILIEGESGTGKDIIARAIHEASRRRAGSYVAINVASLAEGVLESELFGHEKGAFTGAVSQRPGVFERASGGTIFLDEVGEMSHNMQVRLLRVLESGEVLRVGGVKSLQTNVRIVAATNRNLGSAVTEGRFRQDLYYRLKGVSFHLPALRERRNDIPLLIDFFIQEGNRRHGKSVSGIEPAALRLLMDAEWPGNVRQLRNLIDTAVVLSASGRISLKVIESQLSEVIPTEVAQLPVPLRQSRDEAEREMIYGSILALHRDVREILSLLRSGTLGSLREVPEAPGFEGSVRSLASLERSAIIEALRQSNGNRRQASEILGISERTLYRKIREYGLV